MTIRGFDCKLVCFAVNKPMAGAFKPGLAESTLRAQLAAGQYLIVVASRLYIMYLFLCVQPPRPRAVPPEPVCLLLLLLLLLLPPRVLRGP
jgi:hypothetical protein